jgi:hypothetical protein
MNTIATLAYSRLKFDTSIYLIHDIICFTAESYTFLTRHYSSAAHSSRQYNVWQQYITGYPESNNKASRLPTSNIYSRLGAVCKQKYSYTIALLRIGTLKEILSAAICVARGQY